MNKLKVNLDRVKRHGNYIKLGNGRTAREGYDGNLKSISIRQNGKEILFFRGSSLGFSECLTHEDKTYLASLAYGSDWETRPE
jgi:hypothetical protein